LSVDTFFGFGGETNKGGSGYEKAAARRHLFSVAFALRKEINKGGVAEPLHTGSLVDAITMRLTRYL
jgi:hypothetical protein